MGSRKRHDPHRNGRLKAALAALSDGCVQRTLEISAASTNSLLPALLRPKKNGPGDAATGKYAMPANAAKKLTERAVDVVDSVCIFQPLGSLSQKSCRADFVS